MDAKDLPKWQEIEQDFSDTLVIGNGCSMALCGAFGYKDLYKHGCKTFSISDQVQRIFAELSPEHNDFERVLYRLWQLNKVNKILDILDTENKVDLSIASVQEGLLLTVHGVHPSYKDLKSDSLRNVGKFASRFSNVFSLNYDLTLHWAITLFSNEGLGKFTDGFASPLSEKSTQKVRQQSFNENQLTFSPEKTRVLYPHGNLALYKNTLNREARLVGEADGLLSALTDYWKKTGTPLFVSEGTSEKKIESIQSSKYLSTVYERFLPQEKSNITIIGWGMGKQDAHILKKLKESNCKKYAVGIHTAKRATKTIQNEITRFTEALEPFIDLNSITFFNSSSPGCWANGD